MSKEKHPSSLHNSLRQYAQYTALGFQMLLVILVGIFAGRKLDAIFPNEKRWFTISLSLLAVTSSLVWVIVKLIRQQR